MGDSRAGRGCFRDGAILAAPGHKSLLDADGLRYREPYCSCRGHFSAEPEMPHLFPDDSLSTGVVRFLRLADDGDWVLVQALRVHDPRAPAVLFDRYGDHVTRVVLRIIGDHADVPELVNEAMLRAMRRIDSLRDEAQLKAWVSSIAVNVAREYIRARARRRWVRSLTWDDANQEQSPAPDNEPAEALREVYRALDRLHVDERIVFAMRYMEGMDLADIAAATGVSIATIKRRIARAEKRFLTLASANSVLQSLIEEGARWTSR